MASSTIQEHNVPYSDRFSLSQDEHPSELCTFQRVESTTPTPAQSPNHTTPIIHYRRHQEQELQRNSPSIHRESIIPSSISVQQPLLTTHNTRRPQQTYNNSDPPCHTNTNQPVPQSSSPQCDWLHVERTYHADVFLSPPDQSPAELPGVSKFLSVFTTLEIGFIIVTYFFLLCYWRVPFLLPAMFMSQLFLQFILFLYSDYFCRLTYRITWRCPSATTFHQCFFSLCDWLLIFCFFLSWSSALIVIAPVFSAWRNFNVLPIKHNVQIADLTGLYGPLGLQPAASLYFHAGVRLNPTSATAMFIQSAVPGTETGYAFTFQQSISSSHKTNKLITSNETRGDDDVYSFTQPPYHSNDVPENKLYRSTTITTPKPLDINNISKEQPFVVPRMNDLKKKIILNRPSHTLLNTNFNKNSTNYYLKEESLPLVTSTKQQDTSWHTDYGHRVWPNLWLGSQINSTVGAVLLEDSWITRIWNNNLSFSNQQSEIKIPKINVWAVCSDAATLGCDCNGIRLTRITNPPRCSNGNLCGVEMLAGMATQSSVKYLVREAKKILEIPENTQDRFICLLDPNVMQANVIHDIKLGIILGFPFLVAISIIAIRLLVFYLCQMVPNVNAEEILPLPTLA